MTLEELGYTAGFEEYLVKHDLESFGIGRVSSEHKERYVVRTADSVYDAEVIGNLKYTAQSRSDFPAVGDWVAISEYDIGKVLIHHVLPRKSIIERQAIGKHGEKQIIATNVDLGFIVQAVDRDFSLNRLERYLTICRQSGVQPIIVLNKIDLISAEELSELKGEVEQRIRNVPIIAMSNYTQDGINELRAILSNGKTCCLLGSSGVGKSSLLNNLAGESKMKTNEISVSANRGRHVTSHRQLFVLNGGGILIDNPGMREVGIADAVAGLESTFEQIQKLSALCKFKDCSHTSEIECAVLESLDNGDLDGALYDNYQKMVKEKDHFESSIAEKRKKEREFGKMYRSIQRIKKDRF